MAFAVPIYSEGFDPKPVLCTSWLIARKFMYSCNYQLNKFAYNYLNHNCNFGVDKGSFRTVSTFFIGPNSNNKGPISKALIAFTINCSFGINDS